MPFSKLISRSTALIAGIVLFAACGGGDQGPDTTPATVAVTPSAAATLVGGSTLQLTAVAKNSGGEALTAQTITYASSATSIATVSSTGLVTALGPAGTANITATAGTIVSAPVVVTVTAGAAKTLAKSTDLPASPVAGSTNNISVKATDSFGNPVAGVAVTFAVTAGGGTVTTPVSTGADGIATSGFKVSNTLIVNTATATATGLTGSPVSFTGTAVAGAAANITKVGTDPTGIVAGQPFGSSVGVIVTDAVGNAKSGVTVTFAVTAGGGSITPLTATTDATGKATAVFTTGITVGTNTATATVSGLTAVTFTGTTVAGAVASVTVTPKVSVVNVAATTTPTVVAKDANGNTASASGVTYTSRTTAAATVSTSGVVTGVAQGQSMIVASGTSGADSILVVVANATGPVLITDLATFELAKGTTFTPTVIMDMRASGEKLGSTSVTVTWDPTVMTYVSSASTGTGPSPTVNSSSASSGTLSFSMADATGFSGQVQLLKITFTAAATAGKSGTLKLTTSEVSGAGTFTNLLPKTVAVTHPVITK